MDGIEGLDLVEFSSQNVVFDLSIDFTEGFFEIALGGCYGLHGSLRCKKLGFSLEPGLPNDEA